MGNFAERQRTKNIQLLIVTFFIVCCCTSIASEEATFGYLGYSTYNIGDDIQSIAARRFLPETAVAIDREFIHQYDSDKVVNTLMNGWFMQTKKAGWPYPNLYPPQKS